MLQRTRTGPAPPLLSWEILFPGHMATSGDVFWLSQQGREGNGAAVISWWGPGVQTPCRAQDGPPGRVCPMSASAVLWLSSLPHSLRGNRMCPDPGVAGEERHKKVSDKDESILSGNPCSKHHLCIFPLKNGCPGLPTARGNKESGAPGLAFRCPETPRRAPFFRASAHSVPSLP